MNGTNKAIVGIVFGIALAYSVLSLAPTLLGILDDGIVSLYLFAPHGEELWYDLSAGEHSAQLVDAYCRMIDFICGYLGDSEYVKLAVVMIGFVLSVIGMVTPWSLGVKGDTNPVQYLWTKRPRATLRALGAPWGLIPAAWGFHKVPVIVPIVLLPLYAWWSLVITVAMIVPYVIVKGVIGLKVSSAAKKEGRNFESSTGYAVCPKCKRKFDRPKVKCRCGLVVDYPVPNQYGYKRHTCNNGHDMPCVAGKRSNLMTVCPYCSADIDSREAKPVSIAMVGAVGAGKTSLMLASVGEIMTAARARDVVVEAATDGISKQAVAAKDYAAKTASGELDSESLFLRSRDMSDRQIVFNDISGSEFEPREGKALFEEYYKYTGGIIFVFDPVALERGGRGATPMDVFESFHSMFTQITATSPAAESTIPFAVVASRKDVSHLGDDAVRQFLVAHGQEGFVRVMESIFKDRRYFSVCSKGDDTSSA
ncbi:MAG: hypothetical protein Q4Q58_00760, partial [Thermoplasmata archaeon]|nr:hypothetical protein [Thermoplasmata archaeon]